MESSLFFRSGLFGSGHSAGSRPKPASSSAHGPIEAPHTNAAFPDATDWPTADWPSPCTPPGESDPAVGRLPRIIRSMPDAIISLSHLHPPGEPMSTLAAFNRHSRFGFQHSSKA